MAGLSRALSLQVRSSRFAPPLPERFVPVEELFALLQDAVTRSAARIEVSYDERYGYPTELFIDYDEGMADEETRFVIRGFTLR